MKKEKIEINKNYLNNPSPTGYEFLLGSQKIWLNEAKKYADKIQIDNYGNVYAFLYSSKNPHKKTILLDAHADEVGFIVNEITDKGLIKFKCLGGSDIHIMPAARINLWNDKNEKICGVVGHPAIHVHKRKFNAKIEDMYIDIGVSSKKEVENKNIRIGTPITMKDGYIDLNNYVCGRGLDDKIGGIINLNILKTLKKQSNRDYNLVVVNSVQEEVGLYGAKMACNKIKPDVAIAIDVTHDVSTPAYSKERDKIYSGKGAVIMDSPSIQKNIFNIIRKTAKKYEIPHQIITSGGSSGTNTDSYAYPFGIPSGLISIPMKYMHTSSEMVHKSDIDDVFDLIINVLNDGELLKNLNFKI